MIPFCPFTYFYGILKEEWLDIKKTIFKKFK